MIQPEEKKQIVAVLGSHYSITIINHLKQAGFKPKRAPEFTAELIRQLMNSHYENEELEYEILSFVKEKKKEKEKLAKKRQSQFKN